MQRREYRVESAESARAQSREERAQCTMRAQCESTESECRGDSKGLRVREYKVESAESERESRVERSEHSAR